MRPDGKERPVAEPAPVSRAESANVAPLAKALLVAAFAAVSPSLVLIPIAVVDPVLLVVPPAAFVIALGLGALIGLPGYLLLRSLGWANYLTAMAWGAVAGTVFPVGASWFGGGGWEESQRWLLYFAALGGVAGAVFHLTASGTMRKRGR